jgi:hypothetical protein
MTTEERAKVILTEARWTYKPAPDRWSVGETAGHIVLAEGALFASIKKCLASPANPDWEAKTGRKAAFIERVMTAGSFQSCHFSNSAANLS